MLRLEVLWADVACGFCGQRLPRGETIVGVPTTPRKPAGHHIICRPCAGPVLARLRTIALADEPERARLHRALVDDPDAWRTWLGELAAGRRPCTSTSPST